ncbi:MAG: methyltransferase domain-containing protein [Pseudomonadota bacterium]|nr:methyltransferase domain-containing protein [Pseudomonadota bacterium]
MSRFAPDVHVLTTAGQVTLWHARTGRHVPLSEELLGEVLRWTPGLLPPPDLAPLARRLDELHLLRESVPVNVGALIPCRSRLVLTLPDVPALWMPDPAVRTPGGHAWRELVLTPGRLALWRACNGSRTVAQAATTAGLPLVDAVEFLRELTSPGAQAIQLRERPVTRRDPSLERLVAPARGAAPRPAGQYGALGETTLGAYHHSGITDGATHFDDRETTIAHAFGVPHPALGGQRYGERLFDVLDGRGYVRRDAPIVEVGPGDGELGAAFLSRVGGPVDYLRIDASPELLRTQRGRMPGTREILGTATSLPLADRSVGLLVSNEVIADLSAVPYDPSRAADGAAAEVEARLRRYRIPPHEGPALYNLGAWLFLEEIARVLAPGGVAWLSEFGGLDELPEETTQLDHPEVSIHFGHLVVIARALGLRARVEPLADFLRADLGAQQLARHSYEGLRARMRAEGRHLAARAYTPESLALPWPVEGLQWVPLSDPGAGPLLTRFMALTIERE